MLCAFFDRSDAFSVDLFVLGTISDGSVNLSLPAKNRGNYTLVSSRSFK